jgi:hypothetical protein
LRREDAYQVVIIADTKVGHRAVVYGGHRELPLKNTGSFKQDISSCKEMQQEKWSPKK